MTVGRSKVRCSALVLAAQRGADDPLAGLSPKGHKCLLPIAGRPMIERVVAALIAAQEVGEIAISIDRREVLEEVPGFAELIAAKRMGSFAASPRRWMIHISSSESLSPKNMTVSATLSTVV